MFLIPVALCAFMCAWYIISLVQKRNDVADVAWGLGFVLVAWLGYIQLYAPGYLLLASMVSVWGCRLAYHIYMRHRGRAEDARYRAWREAWMWVKTRSFFQVFMLQGVLLYVVALPLILAAAWWSSPWAPLFLFGFCIWCTGMFFEVVGDRQLRAHIQNPTNKDTLCTTGLWQYTRHPNYFGEVTLWWGIWCMSCAATSTAYLDMAGVAVWVPAVSLIGPLTITYLITRVSGIPMLEAAMQNKKGWAEYAARTPIFFPWWPRA